MKTTYYTDQSLIEKNAMDSLLSFEESDRIDQIAVFPDIHYCSEKSIPVGVAFLSKDYFFPLVTGKDMGCGVAYLRIRRQDFHGEFNKDKHYNAFDRESSSMTDEGLGGGNHFLSIEQSEKYVYIIVHTGSRNLGIYMYQENYSLIREHSDDNASLPVAFADDLYVNNYNKIIHYAKQRRMQFLEKTLLFLIKNGYVDKDVDYSIEDSVHNYLEFTDEGVYHRKGSTGINGGNEVVIPLSMTRGSLIVKLNTWDDRGKRALFSCSHGAGRKLSRTDTLKFWHNMKKPLKEQYKRQFPELLQKNGEFENGALQEFDFAYKDSSTILTSQPYLISVDETRPIVTVKFTSL